MPSIAPSGSLAGLAWPTPPQLSNGARQNFLPNVDGQIQLKAAIITAAVARHADCRKQQADSTAGKLQNNSGEHSVKQCHRVVSAKTAPQRLHFDRALVTC
jgi:hypothetical protein